MWSHKRIYLWLHNEFALRLSYRTSKRGNKNSINVDQPRKYLQDIGNDELIEEIKALEKE